MKTNQTTRKASSPFRPAVSKTMTAAVAMLGAMLLITVTADARSADDKPMTGLRKDRGRMPEVLVELSPVGKKLQEKYAALHAELASGIAGKLPEISDAHRAETGEALAAIAAAYNTVEDNKKKLSRFVNYDDAVQELQSAKKAMEQAPARVALMERYLAYAMALPDDHEDKQWVVDEARGLLENRRRDLDEKFPKNLEKAEAELKVAEAKKGELAAKDAELRKSVEDAEKALGEARVAAMKLLEKAGIAAVLSSDKLDSELARFMVIEEADPYWLAVYAQQGPEYAARIERLLADTPLMIRMLIADGATWGKYGKAMEIYENIRKASPRAKEGLFERLALAVSLEHARPIALSTPEQDGHGARLDADSLYNDPVERYLDYEKAWLNGELDPHFKNHDVWSLRMVIDGYQPAEYLSWGRRMLHDFRPDLVALPDESMRYSKVVDEEIQYSSFFLNKEGWSRPDLERMQNGLATGGICGLRAHFGGYILNAFGVPTAARPQKGHAALVRYTPDGWVPYLGGGWGSINKQLRGYRSDTDFLISTQARQDEISFLMAKRAQWIGKAVGEDHSVGWGFHNAKRWKGKGKPAPVEFWLSVSSIVQEAIIHRIKPQTLEAVGEDLGEADGSLAGDVVDVEIPESERKITLDSAGVIHVPAAATSRPTGNTENIRFMPSNLGGFQLHFRRYGNGESFEYAVEAPKAGKYLLSARLVTPAWKQSMDLSINGAAPQSIALPYTKGLWGELEPVEVELKQGINMLTFSRMHHFFRGLSIKDFTLTPVQ